MNRKSIPLIVVLIVVVAAAVLGWLYWPRDEGSHAIRISGNIEMTEVDLAFKTAGRIVDFPVEEGDPVKQGDLIARLDSDQLMREREQAQAAVKAAGAQLEEARAGLRFQVESVASQIAQREADLKSAQAQLQAMLSGSRPQEIEEAKAAVEKAQAHFRQSRQDWERAQTLIKNEDISRAQYDQFKTTFEAAESSLQQAQQQLALVEEGPRQEDIEAARARVEAARAALRQARSLDLEIERTRKGIATLEAQSEREQARLAQVESRLEDTTIQSPIDGVVLVKPSEAGEVVAAGTPVATLGDLQHPWLRGYIATQDLGRVKLGSRVRVRTDSYPGKDYWGEVSYISPEAEFTPKQIQTEDERVKLVYRIKVSLPNPEQELKLNMPCDAEILVEEEGSRIDAETQGSR